MHTHESRAKLGRRKISVQLTVLFTKAAAKLAGACLLLFLLASPILRAANPARVNFIDEEIQAQWGDRPSANLSNDAEFYRRLSLDLTGRIPSADQIRAFVGDPSPDKRNAAIEQMLQTAEFADRWSKWMLDLMHNAHNVYRGFPGRNGFLVWLRDQIAQKQRLDDIVTRVLTATGNNYDTINAGTNFFLVTPPAGPAQDTYDLVFARAATSFLGMGHYDCLLCHNGRGHLDGISSWGARSTRKQAEQMSAFFSRYSHERTPLGGFYHDSSLITDLPTGAYDLNTTDGNRPARLPFGELQQLTPAYRDGSIPATGNWRGEFAQFLTKDPMFARNFANRIWKQMMGVGLAEPIESLDPDRLDPASPPEEPWTFQASHPMLLEKLANSLAQDSDLRGLVRLIAQSSTYQLSSAAIPGVNFADADQLYLHHRSWRLDAEQVHDAVTAATGVPATYRLRTMDGYVDPPEHWAMRLPGSIHVEETDDATLDFLSSFFPGDGNLLPRSSSSSVMQELNLMNSPFVTNRLKVAGSPTLQAAMNDGDDAAIERVFLAFVSRLPSDAERAQAKDYLTKAANRQEAIEDIAWTCVNLPEFLIQH